jgi:hypothetical protein
MDERVDAKGKFYTPRVTKSSVPIIARVADTIIKGKMNLMPDNRLKDELDSDEAFVAITEAEVLDAHTERVLFRVEVVIVNKQSIAWIFPRESSPAQAA